MSRNQTSHAHQGEHAETDLPRLYRQAAWAAIGVIALVAAIVTTVQFMWPKDGQYGGNWINGVSATIAALNVLLTLYILRAALGQLDHLRQDLSSREKAYKADLADRDRQRDQQADQARADIENMQVLLNTQTEALALARADAERAHRETAKARLDLAGPRCSIILESVYVYLHHPSGSVGEQVNESVTVTGDLDQTRLQLRYIFRMKNWGQQPVAFSLDYKWFNTGSYMLFPDQDSKLTWEITHPLRHWMNVGKGESSLFTTAPPPDRAGAALIELVALVNNTGLDVTDTFTWNQVVVPIEVQEFGVLIHGSGILKDRSRQFAIPTRTYASLTDLD